MRLPAFGADWESVTGHGVDPMTAFVAAYDPPFGWRRHDFAGTPGLRVDAHAWRGHLWSHDVVVFDPAQGRTCETAILEVTGWEPNGIDFAFAQRLADASGLSVAVLFQIPAQPLFGLEEDDLIAHTLCEFLDSGEPDWPLLFPMVKSVIRTMDALGEATQRDPIPLAGFVVTGASKRGWTSWLAAATGDPRIRGIAPRVFDNLGFLDQLAHQREVWGGYSEMISPYTSRGLHERVDTPRGTELVSMLDPLAYAARLDLPKLIVNGANDPYWTVDALSRYADRLPGPTHAVVVPNAGHGLEDESAWLPTLAAFARATHEGDRLPHLAYGRGDGNPDAAQVFIQGEPLWATASPSAVRWTAWSAEGPGGRFTESTWSQSPVTPGGDPLRLPTANAPQAVLLQAEFEESTRFRLTTSAFLSGVNDDQSRP